MINKNEGEDSMKLVLDEYKRLLNNTAQMFKTGKIDREQFEMGSFITYGLFTANELLVKGRPLTEQEKDRVMERHTRNLKKSVDAAVVDNTVDRLFKESGE